MPSLASILYSKLIPWSQDQLEERLIVAHPQMSKSTVSYGVEITRTKIPGKRVLVRTHDDGPQKIVRAKWPQAGLHELYIPKLVCVLEGRTDFQAGENIITCGKGHLILLPPNTPNTMGNRSHLEGENRKFGSCDLLQLVLFRDHVQCFSCSSRGEHHQGDKKYIISHPQTVSLFALFVEDALNWKNDRGQLCSQLLGAAFTFLWREINAGRGRTLPTITERMARTGASREITDYLKAHLHQALTIEKVAQAMYMSPSQLARSIRRETGQSFGKLLTEYRITESKRLLRETDWSMTAIARHVGFKSDTYFITFFGKYIGCSPGEFRRKKNR